MFRYFLLIFLYLVWGAGYTIVKDGIEQIPYGVFQFYRYVIAVATLFIMFSSQFKNFENKKIMIKMGIYSFSASLMAIVGMNYSTASKTAFLISISVVIVPLLKFIHNGIKPTVFQFVSVAVCMLGVVLMTEPWEESFKIPDFLLLGAGVMYAYQFITTEAYSKLEGAVKSAWVVCISILIGYLFINAFSLMNGEITVGNFYTLGNSKLLWELLFVGIFITALAWYLEAFALEKISATTVIVISSLEPVFTLITEGLLFREVLGITQIIGGIVIILSTIISGWSINKKHS